MVQHKFLELVVALVAPVVKEVAVDLELLDKLTLAAVAEMEIEVVQTVDLVL